MTTKVLNVFANLETEFLSAQKDLKDVDQNIRKITGREPTFSNTKVQKPVSSVRSRVPNAFGHAFSSAISQIDDQSEEPQRKRRFYGSAFSRLHVDQPENISDNEKPVRKPTLQSSVIATNREVKPRTQALEEQKNDKKSLARNKRMFGMILGTLQKFQSEETMRKDTKRVEIEKKLDAKAEEEKSVLKIQRKELFNLRRKKKAEIRRIEHKMQRVEIHQDWEKSHQHLGNFIQTKAKPHIFWLPVKHMSETEKRLQETKDTYRLIVAEKRAKVQKELSEIDELYKKEEEINDELDEEMELDMNHMRKNDIKSNLNVQSLSVDKMSSNSDITGEKAISLSTNNDNKNGLYPENPEQEILEAQEEALGGDKEFEPIYDE